ncbi:MAG: SBBP repeat-containing protein [Acidobacteria bacterium]|nr:SBBP repeat-containing protein [Acidobacteriota bacterium]
MAARQEMQPYFEENIGQARADIDYYLRSPGTYVALSGKNRSLEFVGIPGTVSPVTLRFQGQSSPVTLRGEGEQAGRSSYFLGSDSRRWRSGVRHYRQVVWDGLGEQVGVILEARGGSISLQVHSKSTGAAAGFGWCYEGVDRLTLDAGGNLLLSGEQWSFRQGVPVASQPDGKGGRNRIAASYRIRSKQCVELSVGGRLQREISAGMSIGYANSFGGSGLESLSRIAVNEAGETLILGSSTSRDFPTGSAVQSLFGGGGTDVVLAKLNRAGNELLFATYIGGNGDDTGTAIAIQSDGGVIVAGGTRSTDFPVRNPMQARYGGLADAFLLKLNSSGSALSFSTYFGGAADETIAGLAVDREDIIYATGWTNNPQLPTVSAVQASKGAGIDAFVLSLDAAASRLQWGTFLGGDGADSASDIAVDETGAVYVAGSTTSGNFPVRGGPQRVLRGVRDAFVTKFARGGRSLVYSTYLGGGGVEDGNALAIDSAGAAYVVGNSTSIDFPVTLQQVGPVSGTSDAFLAKLSPDGSSTLFSRLLGGSSADGGQAVAVSPAGEVYLTGFTDSADLRATEDAPQIRYAGNRDGYAVKLSADGSRILFSTYIGGTGFDGGTALALDSGGTFIVGGVTSSDDLLTRRTGAPISQRRQFLIRFDDNEQSAGSLVVSPTSLSFSTTSVPQTRTVNVNSNGGRLNFSVSAAGGNWLNATPTEGITPATIAVTANPEGLPPATYEGTILVSAAGAPNSPQRVPVSMVVSAVTRSGISLSPAFINFRQEIAGEAPPPAPVSIASTGSTIDFQLTVSTLDGGSWLKASTNGGATPALIDISANAAGLTAGVYSGRLSVSSNDAANSPQSIPVAFTVTAGGSSLIVSPQNGLEFRYQIDGPRPTAQSLFVASSGAPIQFLATASNSGLERWLSVQPRQGATNAVLAVTVDPSSLRAGTYEGAITITGSGQTVTTPVRLTVSPRIRSILQTDTAQLTWATPIGVRPTPSQVRISNPGTDLVTFDVQISTQDGGKWLSVSKQRGGADWLDSATLVVNADPAGLVPGVYSGNVVIQSQQQDPIVIPAALAVSAGKKLVLSQTSLSFTAASGSPGIPQDVSVLSLGGAIGWTAQVVAGASWLSIAQASGMVPSGGLNRVPVNVSAAGFAPGEYHGEIDFDSPDVDNRPEKVTVVLVVRPPGTLPPAPIPAGVAFAATVGTAPAPRDVTILYGGAVNNARWTATVVLDPESAPNTPTWLRVDRDSGTFAGIPPVANLTLRASASGLTPGVPYRATVHVTISGNLSTAIPVLLVVSAGAGASQNRIAARSAGCAPSTYFPVFTTLDQNFVTSNGRASTTELVILDDCGNAASPMSVGAQLTSGDRPFDLIALNEGSWRATWVPRRAPGSVTMNVVASDGASLEGSAPPITGIVTGSIQGPVLDSARPFLTPAGHPQVAIAPGSLFLIQGSNLTSSTGPTRVTLGTTELVVSSASSSAIVVTVPNGLPINRSLSLVVQAGDFFAAPESVLVATTWPVALSVLLEHDGSAVIECSGGANLQKDQLIHGVFGSVAVESVEILSQGVQRVRGRVVPPRSNP